MGEWNYERIKRVAKEIGVRVGDLCALAEKNDPFYTGRPSEVLAARWFAELWQRFGYTRNVHLRRVHYRLFSQDPPILRPDGTPYENTDACWDYLCSAGKWARYLELVDARAFVDRRNPDPKVYTDWRKPGDLFYEDPDPSIEVDYDSDDWDCYTVPEIPELDTLDDLPTAPGFDMEGYTSVQQAYHVEVWCEKTSMNDVLIPLCGTYNVNLITGAGEMSITAIVDFLGRVRRSERPARILYISDYDPAGLGMPISVARKVEYWQRTRGDGDLDIRLEPIVLTADQVAEYRLPRKPGKKTDKRRAHWEKDHGQGVVELDALQALYPGRLRTIVQSAILNYYDDKLDDRAQELKDDLESELDDYRKDTLEFYQSDLDALEADYDQLRSEFEVTRERFAELTADFQEEVDGYQERMQEIVERGRDLYAKIHDSLDNAESDLMIVGVPEPKLPEESDGLLYASGRDYLDQLVVYKTYRHNNGAGGDEAP